MDESFGPAATGGPEPAVPSPSQPVMDDPVTVTAVRSPAASRLGGPIPWAILASIALLTASLTIALVVVPPEVDSGPDSAAGTVPGIHRRRHRGPVCRGLRAPWRQGPIRHDPRRFLVHGSVRWHGEQRLDVVGASRTAPGRRSGPGSR